MPPPRFRATVTVMSLLATRARAFACLTALAALGVARPAAAHIQMSAPVSRQLDDAVKSKPCGPYVKGAAAQVEYTAGQQIKVDFRETIDHKGCFQLSLSTDNDVTWTLLKQDVDPAGDVPAGSRDVGSPTSGAARSITATLPPGVTCANCTIQLTQIMLEGTAQNGVCNANQAIDALAANGDVYFACADVNIVAGDVPDSGAAGSSSSGAATSSSSGATTSTSGAPAGSSSGARPGTSGAAGTSGGEGSSGRNSVDNLDDGGCHVGAGNAGSAAALLAVVGVALRRRQRSGNKLR